MPNEAVRSPGSRWCADGASSGIQCACKQGRARRRAGAHNTTMSMDYEQLRSRISRDADRADHGFTGRGSRGSATQRDADPADHGLNGTRIPRISDSTGRGSRGSRLNGTRVFGSLLRDRERIPTRRKRFNRETPSARTRSRHMWAGIGAVGPLLAAAILGTDRRIQKKLRRAQAARGPCDCDLGPFAAGALATESADVARCGPCRSGGRYYLDEAGWAQYRWQRRRRALVVGGVLVAALVSSGRRAGWGDGSANRHAEFRAPSPSGESAQSASCEPSAKSAQSASREGWVIRAIRVPSRPQ